MNMKISRIFPPLAVLCLCLSITLAQAASVTGTVTNKTTGKPSAGDTVTLVDVQAGMSDAATATTDAKGHYTLQSPGGGAFLVKATHQGGSPQTRLDHGSSNRRMLQTLTNRKSTT